MKVLVLKIARFVFGILLFAATLEVCARVEDKVRFNAPLFGDYSLESLYGYDALGKYGLPHAGYTKWQLNEAGYRGPALKSGRYRIVCIGSSETFGLVEAPDHEWPRQLEDKLNRQLADRFEVVNVAYPGMTMGTSLRRLPQVLETLHPQMAVIYPGYTSYILDGRPEPWPLNLPPRGQLVPDRHTKPRIAGKVQTLLKSILPEKARLRLRWIAARLALHGKNAGMAAIPQQNVDAFHADIDHLVAGLEASGVRVILVTHATRFGTTVTAEDRPFLSDWRQYYPALREDGFLDMEQRMRAAEWDVARSHHLPIVDAATQLAPGKQNFAEFVHFTDQGADALSSLIAAQVAQEQIAGQLTAKP